MRVAIVFFGPISNSRKLLNFASYNNEIVVELNKRGLLTKLFCKDFSEFPLVQCSRVEIFSGSIYSKIALLFYRIASRIFRVSERSIFELFFDLFVRTRIDYNEFDVLLLLRETNEKLCLIARKKNKKIMGLMSIYPLTYEQDEILKHGKKWGVEEVSNYTNRARAKSYDRILSTWDMIVPVTSSSLTRQVLSDFAFNDRLSFVDHEFGPEKLLFRPVGIENSKEVTFLTTTDDTLKKGLPVLLSAWDTLPSEFLKRANLVVVGEIGSNLKSVISRFSSQNVQYVGYSLELDKYYQTSNVFICPSVIDMGPRTVKQAMCCGLPVIVSNQCGVAAFVENHNEGFTFDVNQVEQLVGHLIFCIENPHTLAVMGKNAYKKSKLFDNNSFAIDIADKLVNLK